MNRAIASQPRTTHARRAGLLLCALAALAMIAGPARAQARSSEPDTPRAFLRPSEIEGYTGSPVELRLVVEGTREAEIAALPEIDGLGVRIASKQVSVNSGFVIGGRSVNRSSVIFTLVVVPSRDGTYTIPPIEVLTDSGRVRTTSATLTAAQPAEWDTGEARLRVDETALVPGQRTGFELELSFPSTEPVADLAIDTEPVGGAFRVELPGRGKAGYARRAFEVELFGQSSYGVVGERRDARGSLTTLTVTGELEAVAPGAAELGPVRFRVARRTRGRGLGNTREVVTVTTDAVPIEVAPFPDAGRPDGFTGTVGVYRIGASASTTSVRVGDPIELTLEVRGPEPFASFTPPVLASRPGFAREFRVSPDWRRADPSTYGVRRFETTIRPRSADATAIPAIEIAYFDPLKSEYGTDRTRAIPIEVEPVRRVTAEDAVVAGSGADDPAVGPDASLRSTRPGLWALPSDPVALTRRGVSAAEAARSPAFVALVGAPPGLALIALAARAAAHRRNPARERRRRAVRNALRLVRRGDAADASRSFIADVLDRPRTAVTASDASEAGLGRDDPIVRALRGAERSRFAAADGDTGSPTTDELIAALRRAGRRLRRSGAGRP